MRPPLNRISRSRSLVSTALHTRPRAIEISTLEQRVLLSAHNFLNPHPHHTHVPAVHAHSLVGGAKKPATTTTLAAPSSLTAALSTSATVQLNWKDNCTTASGYYVLSSLDGGSFFTIATIGSSSPTSYVDATVAGGHTYTYEIEAYGGGKTTAASNKASVTTTPTAPTAPTGLSASPAGTWIDVAWNGISSATGYYLLRSTDGNNFAQIAQLTSGSTTTDLDSSVSAGQVYYYEVEAYNSVGASALSGMVSITAPAAQSSGTSVAITTRFSDELVITASGADDTISLSQSGSVLNISADGQTYAEPLPQAGVFVYTRGGNDGIDIDQSVTAATTIETIDGAPTAIISAGTDVSAWIDSTDSYSGTGIVHRVSSFAGGVSKAQGASLPNPTDSGTVTAVNLSLWGTGPVAGDVNQGESADCYFLASLAAFAGVKSSVLTQSAVDMGDGTYTVQFESGSTPVFVRISNMMPAGPFAGFMYAHPGANDTIWAMVLEKAFCYFRTGANTFASINGGLMGEAYSDLGVNSSSFSPGAYTDSSFYSMVSSDLNNGEAVTLATSSSAPNLVSSHAYTLVSVYNLNGVNYYVMRNPWGSSGDSLENNQGYATLTFAQITANSTLGYQAIG